MKISLFFLTFIFFTVMSCSAIASEDLYPCNLEVKSPVNITVDSGSFYARTYVEDRLADPSSPLRFRWMTLFAPQTGEWGGLFQSTEEYRYIVQNVQFSPSLEKLGVSYRMGFCYLGPVDESTHGSYALVGTISTGSASDYIPYAASVTGVCDLRKVGSYKKARADTELTTASVEPDMQFSVSLGQLSSSEVSFDYLINAQITQVPRFCKLNVEINEVGTGDRPTDVDLNQAQFLLQIDQNLL